MGLAASALLMIVTAIGAPTASAAPRAPKFDVTTNVDRMSGYGQHREFIRFRFKSTNPNRQTGFARLVIPTKTFTFANTQVVAYFSGAVLQRANAMADGYFSVLNGSCAVAKLDTFTPSALGKQTIDVKFDCKPGKSFSIILYTPVRWWNMDGTSASD